MDRVVEAARGPDAGTSQAPGSGGLYLVAVSGSGNSEYLIRWTSVAARRMNAAWCVLHVVCPSRESDRESVSRSFSLARGLGGDAFAAPGLDVAATILRWARVKKATTLVIGKTADGLPTLLGARSVMDTVIRDSGDLDLIVLRGENPLPPPRGRLKLPVLPARIQEPLSAAAALAAVTVVGLLGRPILGYRSVSILYLLAIISLPFACGRLTVLASALVSGLLWNFLFIPPELSFSIGSLEDLLMLGAFFLSAFVGGHLTSRLKGKETDLALRERRMALLYGFASSLSRVRGADGVAAVAAAYIRENARAELAVWLRGEDGTLDVAHRLGGAASSTGGVGLSGERARLCFASREPLEVAGEGLYLPLVSPEAVMGVAGFSLADRRAADGEGKELLATLAANLAMALERELLTAENERHRLHDESERLSRVLLNHVSHELRTPLTTIKASVSGLLDGSVGEAPGVRSEMLAETLKAADKLNVLVEDLLSMTRLESGTLRLRPERCYLAELLGAAQAMLAEELAGRSVTLLPGCADAEFEVDPALAVQAFKNVMRNYAAYTPPEARLEIDAEDDGRRLLVRFSDDGPGVPRDELSSLFGAFFRGANSASVQGCGLGLSICRGIVEAHGGTVSAGVSAAGGLEIALVLPRKP